MAQEREPLDTAGTDEPHPVDIHVGQRMRQRRSYLGISQKKLGIALGVTFQQIQKYERAANRIVASRLFDMARVLDVPVTYFFEGMAPNRGHLPTAGVAEEAASFEDDPLTRRETMDLIRAYYAIPAPGVRRRVLELAKALAQAESETRSR